MKYMLLIYGNQERWESVGADELAEIIRQTDALNQALLESGELVGAYGVADQAEEYLGSFTIVDCDSEERALEIAAMNPASRYSGVEVRALLHEADAPM